MVAPRARACSYSSKTTTPAPSPNTKPSRSLSQGREAVAGSSLRVDRARAAAKPPTPRAEMVDSEPPATITSASPYWIKRAARPMLCKPVVQAVTAATLGPLRLNRMLKCPEIILMMEPGTKKGEIRRGPRASNSAPVSSIMGRPPMPEPTITPIRSALSSVISMPLSRIACVPAAMP